jgi:hypothetical protein
VRQRVRPDVRLQLVLVAELRVADDAGDETARATALGSGIEDLAMIVAGNGGACAAVLGTRVVAVFAGDAKGTEAALVSAAQACATTGRVTVAAGVASGAVSRGPATPSVGVPVVGEVADRALLLGSVARPGEILIDQRLAERLSPRAEPLGNGFSWALGTSRRVVGLGGDVECWDLVVPEGAGARTPAPDPAPRARRSGSRTSRAGTGASRSTSPRSGGGRARNDAPADGTAPTRDRPSRPETTSGPPSWSEGQVRCWFEDHGRGVIAASSGTEYYVDRRFVVAGRRLAVGDEVFFVAREPLARGRNPLAADVVLSGERLEVRVDHVDEAGLGFAVVLDPSGSRQILMLDLETRNEVATGDWVEVEVTSGAHANAIGPIGVPL